MAPERERSSVSERGSGEAAVASNAAVQPQSSSSVHLESGKVATVIERPETQRASYWIDKLCRALPADPSFALGRH